MVQAKFSQSKLILATFIWQILILNTLSYSNALLLQENTNIEYQRYRWITLQGALARVKHHLRQCPLAIIKQKLGKNSLG